MPRRQPNPTLFPYTTLFRSQFIQEIVPPSTPLLRRHTLDVFVAQADPGVMPLFFSTRASQYQFGSRPTPPGNTLIEQMQFNPPNLPLFLQGTRPFFSDYMDIAASQSMLQDDSGVW